MASSWSAAWAGSWLNSWGLVDGVPSPQTVIYGGDDAPRTRKRRKERRDLFREIEATVHELLRPPLEASTDQSVGAAVPGDVAAQSRRLVDELVVLAEGQHQLVQRAAALRAELAQLEVARREQEEDDEFIMFM